MPFPNRCYCFIAAALHLKSSDSNRLFRIIRRAISRASSNTPSCLKISIRMKIDEMEIIWRKGGSNMEMIQHGAKTGAGVTEPKGEQGRGV